ncbi:uncharacterized protein LOC103132400 isoform X2 [Poecilia formosa]|uniref:uncharacterized protein LOC103132400 isoform X2 n=1 Tax=Poecilia formosa TaxID=48698 RepID=UPI000443ACF7|nr:PREDICTED: uncharacterized protein LOC103132400 isoform X2 [Poecilia formosa]
MTGDTLLCFFLSLQISSIPAAVNQFTGSAGEDFSGHCGSSFPGTRKIFCRENCEEGNVLIETTKNSAENGRYGIEYVKAHGPNIYSFYVKISGLTESDSGRYRCGLGESSESYQDFTLSVSGLDQSTSSVSTPSASTPTDSSNLNSSTESFTPTGSSTSTSENTPTPDCSPSQSAADVWLFVLPALAAIAALLSAMMMMVVFCRRRSKKPQTDSPVETNQSPAACETTRIDDDDVREEDGRWRSADVEIYLAYIDAISSSVTAAADQRQAPDDEDDEAEVDFSSRLLDSALRAGGGVSSDVLYSDIRHDELLYSNIF